MSDPSILSGKWTYRSFNDDPALVNGDPNKALALFFAEAVFTFEVVSETSLKGEIDWTGGGLDLEGVIGVASDASPTVQSVGTGRRGSSTDGWEYDHHGQLAYVWPNGVNQTPAIVGNVIRAKPHNGAPAGYVASFVAVKQS